MHSSLPRTWIVAKVIIIRPDDKILAIRRSRTAPHQPLCWDLPGGLIEFGEDPTAGSIREAREETGQIITGLTPVLVTSSHPHDEYEVCIYFQAAADGTEVTLSYEHDRFQWVTSKEFDRLDAEGDYKVAVVRALASR